MKLKLDENLGVRGKVYLETKGYDVCTVKLQGIEGAKDEQLIAKCKVDERALVTLDLDFATPLRFPPELYHGIAVLRLPKRVEQGDFEAVLETLARALTESNIIGHLWIVEKGRLRIFERPR